MATERQQNWLGQQRVDIPHLRSLESAAAADFDLLAGRIICGSNPFIVNGFDLNQPLTRRGKAATAIQINVAGATVMHPTASETGTIFSVPADRAPEILNTANTRVLGGFAAGQINYIGLDLRRTADETTADLVQFYDPNSGLEKPKTVPLARTLDYVIVISNQDFSTTPGTAPIAKVTTNADNNVVSIEDARNMFGRLGAGGTLTNPTSSYNWPGNRYRDENLVDGITIGDDSTFFVGDKSITSLKGWMDAMMTRVWEVGGGADWFSPTADRNVTLTRTGAALSNGEFFSWDGATLSWTGLSMVFDNSGTLSTWYNDITSSSVALPDGYCLYVDIDRTQNRVAGTNALTAQIAPFATLGTPTIPGSRWILAWRKGSGSFCIYTRDTSFPVNSSYIPATNTSLGIVKLSYASSTPPAPVVGVLNASGESVVTGVSRSNPGGGGPGPGTLSLGQDVTDDTVIQLGNASSKTFERGMHTLSAYNVTVGDGTNSIGDFITSDYGGDMGATMNAALAALPAAGGSILIKNGTYAASTPIVVPNTMSFVSFTGESRNVTITSTNNTVITVTYGSNTVTLNLRNLKILTTDAGSTAIGLSGGSLIVNATDCNLRGIRGQTTAAAGIWGGVFSNCSFNNTTISAEVISGVFSNLTFRNCSFTTGSALGAVGAYENSANVSFQDCQFSGSDPTSILVQIYNNGAGGASNFDFDRCAWTNAAGRCLLIDSGTAACTGIRMKDNWTTNGVGGFLTMDFVNDVQVDGCTILADGTSGMAMFSIGTYVACNTLRINNNHLTQVGTNGGAFPTRVCVGILINTNGGSEDVVIDGNVIHTFDIGMWLEKLTNATITNNVIRGDGATRGIYGVYSGYNSGSELAQVAFSNNGVQDLKDGRFGDIVGFYTDSNGVLSDVEILSNNFGNFGSGSATAGVYGILARCDNGLAYKVTIDDNAFDTLASGSGACRGVYNGTQWGGGLGTGAHWHVTNNVFSGLSNNAGIDCTGIYMLGYTRSTVSNNSFDGINNSGSGDAGCIYLQDSTNNAGDCTVAGNTGANVSCPGGSTYGVAVNGRATRMAVVGNTFDMGLDPGSYGVEFGDADQLLIEGNNLNSCHLGIFQYGGTPNHVQIIGNNINNYGYCGIYSQGGPVTAWTVTGNEFYGTSGQGAMYWTPGGNMARCVISNNVIEAGGHTGIQLPFSFTEVNICNNVLNNVDYGIYAPAGTSSQGSTSFVISNNEITFTVVGIFPSSYYMQDGSICNNQMQAQGGGGGNTSGIFFDGNNILGMFCCDNYVDMNGAAGQGIKFDLSFADICNFNDNLLESCQYGFISTNGCSFTQSSFSGNNISANSVAGLSIAGGGTVQNCVFNNNRIDTSGINGIFVTAANLSQCSFSNNNILIGQSSSIQAAIRLYSTSAATSAGISTNVVVNGNNISVGSSSIGYCIIVSNMTDVSICSNNLSGSINSGGGTWYGIDLNGDSSSGQNMINVTITGNIFDPRGGNTGSRAIAGAQSITFASVSGNVAYMSTSGTNNIFDVGAFGFSSFIGNMFHCAGGGSAVYIFNFGSGTHNVMGCNTYNAGTNINLFTGTSPTNYNNTGV